MTQPGNSSNVEFDENFRGFVKMMEEINMRPDEFLNILHDGLISHKKLKNTIEAIKQVKKNIVTTLKIQRIDMKNLNEIPSKTKILREEEFVIKQEVKKLEPILQIQEDRKMELEKSNESNILIQREKQFPLHVEPNVMNTAQLKEKVESQKQLITQKENELIQLTSSIWTVNETKTKLHFEKIRLLSAIKLKEDELKNIQEKRKEQEKGVELFKMTRNISKSNSKTDAPFSSPPSSPVVLNIPTTICTRITRRNDSTSTCTSTQSIATPKKKNDTKKTNPQPRKKHKIY